jgi:Domain of unknown function (DUF5110)
LNKCSDGNAKENAARRERLRHSLAAQREFDLYEDESDGCAYEKGVYAKIPLYWDDVEYTLRIGERIGRFPGMLETTKFGIVLVRENHGVGGGLNEMPKKGVQCSEHKLSISP